MARPSRHRSSIVAVNLTFAAICLLAVPSSQAQTFNVLHNFTFAGDGGFPSAGVTLGAGGNLYGTTYDGGSGGYGVVYKLAHASSGWTLTPLYSFQGGADGGYPEARVIFGSDGTLYGTTSAGGDNGNGTVFRLRPQPQACKTALCPWSETVLYRFQGGSDGGAPGYGDLTFDSTGNIYGTTVGGGLQSCDGGSCGVVFKLTPSGSNYTESVLYSFTGGNDGANPYSGVIFDSTGNLYGTAYSGGANSAGTVYELVSSGSGWTEKTLNDFPPAGGSGYPIGGLTLDSQGNLFGTGFVGGTVFELMPSGGDWAFTLLHTFDGFDGPFGSLTRDAAGNLYGTNATGGPYDNGVVFKLTPSGSAWTYTDLYDFTGGNDGGFPVSNVVIDGKGNLYGTAYLGGTDGGGVVWEITP